MTYGFNAITATEDSTNSYMLQKAVHGSIHLWIFLLMLLSFSMPATADDAKEQLLFTSELKTVNVFSNKDTLISDIESLRKVSITKDNFETAAEYEARKFRYFQKQNTGKGYRVTLAINNVENSKAKLAYFDPETELLWVEMPSISRDIFWASSAEGKKINWIHHSFVELASKELKPRTYKATNRLGASIDVVEMSNIRYGMGVLSQASNDYSKDWRQRFSFTLSKKDAKEILEKGKINLEVVFDPRYPNAEDSPFLIQSVTKNEPTFNRPIDITTTRYALPVRLLNIQVLSKTGAEIFSAKGEQIDVNPIRK